jgi:N-methylhydantoinase A/oxoprolinase/acetone carboxylase beta subunit
MTLEIATDEIATDIGGPGTDVVCLQEQRCETPVYQRDHLPIGAQFVGPAIVEQLDTTTVVYPGFLCQADVAGSLLLHSTIR